MSDHKTTDIDIRGRLSRRQLLRLSAAEAGAAALGLASFRFANAETMPPEIIHPAPSMVDMSLRSEAARHESLASLNGGSQGAPGSAQPEVTFAVDLSQAETRLPTRVEPGDVVLVSSERSMDLSSASAVVRFRNQRSRESVVGFASVVYPIPAGIELHANTQYITMSHDSDWTTYNPGIDPSAAGATYRIHATLSASILRAVDTKESRKVE